MRHIITDTIQGVVESVDRSERAYSVRIDYLISHSEIKVEPVHTGNDIIEHVANVQFTVKVLSRPNWSEIRFNDSEAFLNKRAADIASAPDIAGSAADYQDEQDAKSAVAHVWSKHDKPEQRAWVIERFLKEGVRS